MPKIIDMQTFDRIRELLKAGNRSAIDIANSVGVSDSLVYRIAAGEHFYQASEVERARRRLNQEKNPARAPRYLPTPEEIAEACKRILAARLRRSDEDEPAGWTPPMFSARTLANV